MDEQTFERAAREYARRLFAVAYRMLGNRADAEDAVQRALLKCFAARDAYSPEWAVSTWLYRALTNVCIDEMRRRRTSALALRASAGSASGVLESRASERVDVERALARVPREARMLLALHYVDGLSSAELARVRGISVNTVKSQLARGKAIMRQVLAAGAGPRPKRQATKR